MPADNPTLVVHHQEPLKHEIQQLPARALGDGEIALRIDKFGLTSNNVTYAVLGHPLHYFKFFPVEGPWSALPVWGLATVLASRFPGVSEGARVYGYFPAARETTLRVAATTQLGFRVDRPELPPQHALYGQYTLLDRDPLYLAAQEELMLVMRPLFMTGLLLADYLSVSQRMGAESVLISSAASKTSYGLARALQAAGQGKVIGLASERSAAAARALGFYDTIVSYDELASLDPARTAVYVDVAGSVPVRQALAGRLARSLRGIIAVGLTHWSDGVFGGEGLSVPVETFFAPGWSARRQKEAGASFFGQLRTGWLAQMESAQQHFKLVRKEGSAALSEAFDTLVQGRAAPEEAWVHTL
jgi:NADPH:quinone reductase-like Zn-dependent oxidoreductase